MNILINYPDVPALLLLVIFFGPRRFMIPRDLKRTEWMLVASALAIPVCEVARGTANALSPLRPLKYDQFVYPMEDILGQPSFILGRLAEQHARLKGLISASYNLLPVMIVATFATYLTSGV